MATILVFQHSSYGLPGRLGVTLRDHGFKLDIRRVDLSREQGGAPVPTDLDNIHGVVSLGGPQNVDEPHPWIKPERDLLKAAHDAELPVIGVCLGHQLLAQALGGTVEKMDVPEIGYETVTIGVPGQTDIMLAGIPWSSRHFLTHGYHVTKAPEGAKVMASSAKSPIQIFKAGVRTYGFQFHFEADRNIAEALTANSRSLLTGAGTSADEISKQADAHYNRFAVMADRLCVNLATYCFPVPSRLRV